MRYLHQGCRKRRTIMPAPARSLEVGASSFPWKPLVVTLVVFGVSRLLFFYSGIRFAAWTLNWMPHYIDPYLLKHDLLRSVYYLHIQPPLFNLFLGGVLKLFPNHERLAFHSIYLLLGVMLSSSLLLLMMRL